MPLLGELSPPLSMRGLAHLDSDEDGGGGEPASGPERASSQDRIKALVDKLSGIGTGLKSERGRRRATLSRNLQELERLNEGLTNEAGAEYKALKERALKLQDEVTAQHMALEMLQERRDHELEALCAQVRREIEAERSNREQSGEMLAGLLHEQLSNVTGEVDGFLRNREFLLRTSSRRLEDEARKLRQKAAEERQLAMSAGARLGGILARELKGVEDLLKGEIEARKKMEAHVLSSLDTAGTRVEGAARKCSQEREAGHGNILKLLEATCSDMEKRLEAP